MSIFVIEFQELSLERYGHGKNCVDGVYDTMEEAIDEITTFRDFLCHANRVLFDGRINWQGDRRYLFTWIDNTERSGPLQRSYIVRELKETEKVKEAAGRQELWNRLKEPIY